MCFPPEIKRVPLSSAVTPSANPKSQSDEPLSRPRVSEDFDRAVSQFMAGFQVPAQTQQNSAVSPLVAGLQTHQSAKQNRAAFQQQGANERAVSQVDLLAQLQRRVNLTVTRQQAPSAIRFPSAVINGRSMTFSSTGLNETSALLSAAAPLQSSATIPQCPVSSLPGTPAVSPPSIGIPASITSSRFMSNGTGVTISGVNPFSSNIFSAVSPLRNSMITASSPLSALGINFASSALDSDEGEEKKVRRIMSNRQSAKRSRQRKRERLDELEDEVAALTQAREEANRKLKEAETSVDGLRAANERMEEEVERLRREMSSTGRQSQISPQLASPAVPAADLVEAVPACDEASPAKKLRGIDYNGNAADVLVHKVNNPSSPTSDVTRTDYTCTEASLKEEAIAGDGLGFFGGGWGPWMTWDACWERLPRG